MNMDTELEFNMEVELPKEIGKLNPEVESQNNLNNLISNTNISEPYINHLMDIKSKSVYDKWSKRYSDYAKTRNIEENNVTTFMNWLCSMNDSKQFAPTTIVTAGSCVNSRMKLSNNINFMNHILVKDLIKKICRNHAPKQAAAFSSEQIEQFVLNASDSLDIEVKKLIAQIGIQGALRVSELVNLEYNDVTFLENGAVDIFIKKSKTDPASKGHHFIITPNCNPKLCCVTRLQKYMDLMDTKMGRLFRKISPSGKPTRQPIGINTMGTLPRFIAHFLDLTNVDEFSGHSFRRTSATLLSEQGVSLVELKQHGRWKSSSVAERYVNNTKVAKMKTSNLLQNSTDACSSNVVRKIIGQTSKSLESKSFDNCSFSNCSINIVNND